LVLLTCLSFSIRCCLGAGMVSSHLSNEKVWRLGNTTALKAALLTGYDETTAPPGPENDRGTTVYVQLALNQFTEFDTVNEKFSMFAWWRNNWEDPRLTWTPEEWDGIEFVTFKEGTDIWAPDTTIYESTMRTEVMPSQINQVYANGTVYVSKPLIHSIPCNMEMNGFPWDKQICSFTWGSWMHDVRTTSVAPMSFTSSDGTTKYDPFVFTQTWDPLTEFRLLRVRTTHKETYYSCCIHPYATIEFSLEMQRVAVTYLWGIILPLVLTTLAGFGAFIVNPDAGERIGLGVTIILATAAIYIVADSALPKSKEMTDISVIYAVSIFMSVATLLVSIVNTSLYCVRNVEGLFSESSLLTKFMEADKDQSGDLDKEEIVGMLMEMGLAPAKIDIFLSIVKAKQHIFDNSEMNITFPQWYDMVEILSEDDYFACRHSPLMSFILRPLLASERKQRKAFVVRRAQIAMQKNSVSKNITFEPDLCLTKGEISALRKRKGNSGPPKVQHPRAASPKVQYLSPPQPSYGHDFQDEVEEKTRLASREQSRHPDALDVGKAAEENAQARNHQDIGVKISSGPHSIDEDVTAKECLLPDSPTTSNKDAITIGIEMMDTAVVTVSDDLTGADSNASSSTDDVQRESLTGIVSGDLTRSNLIVSTGEDDVPHISHHAADEFSCSDSNPPRDALRTNDDEQNEKGGGHLLITEHELNDPSEQIARRLAGYIDFFCVCTLPVAYIIFVFCLFAAKMTVEKEFEGTVLEHVQLDGTMSSSCCFKGESE